jgi:hypothetical protein
MMINQSLDLFSFKSEKAMLKQETFKIPVYGINRQALFIQYVIFISSLHLEGMLLISFM